MKSTVPGVSGTFSRLEYYYWRDYLRCMARRKWIILSVTLVIALGTAVVVSRLPNLYRATTVILVDPRKVPDSYVQSTVTSGVADRLGTLRQQILSSTRLLQVIDEMGLYTDLKTKVPQEQLVDSMRQAIDLDVVAAANATGGLGAFRISYANSSPVKAAQVTNRLASLFIEQNIKEREQQVLGTAEFIDRELEESRKELQTKEDKIRDLKSHFVADLPESQNAHVQALTSLQLELRGELDAIGRAQQQIMYLQAVLRETRPVVNLDATSAGSSEAALQQQLAKVQGDMDQLRQRYGLEHPEVLKKQVEAQKLQDQIDALEKTDLGTRRPDPASQSRNPVVESQIGLLQQEVTQHTQRQKEIKQEIAFHQGKLERIPIVDQQIASVMRDYEMAQQQYRHLLDRKFSADMSSDLESRQKGERFVILDPAQVPERPFSPNRPLIDGAALPIGLLIGLALVFVLELIDETVKTDREVKGEFQLPVLGEIPWILTTPQRRRKQLWTAAAIAANAILAVAYAAVIVVSI